MILKNSLMMLLLLLCANAALHAEEATAVTPQIPVMGYKLIWSDEFDGDTLDKTKWAYRSLGPRRDAINVKETVSLDGQGHLVLTTQRNGDKIHPQSGGWQVGWRYCQGFIAGQLHSRLCPCVPEECAVLKTISGVMS